MSIKIIKTENCRLSRVGVSDGVAGTWISPRYIEVPANDYVPGTRQYHGKVAKTIRRSYKTYKGELESAYD